jgi:ATP-dependent DNA helicase RecG
VVGLPVVILSSSQLILMGYESIRALQEILDEIKISGAILFIDEAELLLMNRDDLLNLTEGYESMIRAFPLPKYKVSVVHGQMKPADKEFEMQRFVKGETQIMVATTVIEVGVNVPNASIMVIENAERFGLSQLHQLRGRVGRGSEKSYCILMSGNKLSNDGKTRLQTMVNTSNGFEISEIDLQLRGPGDLQGTQQSGVLDLHIADLAKDQRILQEARVAAQEILATDVNLTSADNSRLRTYLSLQKANQINWEQIS